MGLYVTVSTLSSVDDMMINDCGAVDGMKTGRENQSTLRKPTPVPLRPP
jgi:hypothetical protein